MLICASECDRAFTRSDALAKHMRTVHETEALRPSDPIPKSMQPTLQPHSAKPAPKLKLILKASQSQLDGQPSGTNGTTNGHDSSGWVSSYPQELGVTAEEEAHGSKELYRLLRRQVHWAEEEAESLKRSVEMLEELRKKEWIEKEILLDQAINADIGWHERRREVLAGLADKPISDVLKAAAGRNQVQDTAVSEDPVEPPVEEAAAVLASLHQG